MTTSATRVQLVDPDSGNPYTTTGSGYQLVGDPVTGTGASMAANTGTAPIGGVAARVYIWEAQFTGTGPLKLQSLSSDKVTWRDVASLSSAGIFQGEIRIGANAVLRLISTTALTSVSSNIS